jgi:uncharacterized protein YndB with AHSA1/START domain
MTRDDRPAEPADSVVVDCDLAEPPEQVWKALTVPELLADWLMPNDFRPQPGRHFTFQGGPGSARIDCEVMAVEPCRLLRYSWCSGEPADGGGRLETVVTFELSGTATGGTHLRIVHCGFASSAGQSTVMLAARSVARSSVRGLSRGGTGFPLAPFRRSTITARLFPQPGLRRAA